MDSAGRAATRPDLLIIGGGVNGLGIAVDAARRGLSVLLVEKRDIGAGTTSASSRLIHGGLRYLQYGELGLVRESLGERGLLVRQRPHLVRPLELLIPGRHGCPPPMWMVGAGLALYHLLARDPLFPAPRGLSAAAARRREPDLSPEGLVGAFEYLDAQVEFPERLCVELRGELLAAGGAVRTHTRVEALRAAGGVVRGAALRDEITGAQDEVEAALVINAAGPWVDAVNALLPSPPPPLIGGTRGTHVVLPRRPGGPRGALYATARRDGRPFFLLPWDGRLLVGTTDVPFRGNPDDVRTEPWEVEYLLEETGFLFPEAGYTRADVQHVTVGVRPLPASRRGAAAITRRHFLVDHAARGGPAGLVSVVGGKLTTYRSLAETVVNRALVLLGRPAVPCPTRDLPPAPGIEELRRRAAAALADRTGGSTPDPAVVERLVRVYGPGVETLLASADRPELLQPLTPVPTDARPYGRPYGRMGGCPALRVEAAHAIRAEGARTVEDVTARRLVLLPPGPGVVEAVRRAAAEAELPLA